MALTIEEMRYVALLARIGMTDDEIDRMRNEMSEILDHFIILNQVDTQDVPPTAHSVSLKTVMRDDEVNESLPKEDLLAGAPNREEDFIRVRSVLE